MSTEWPQWEVFVRARRGLAHQHAGTVHAADGDTALRAARDLFTRRQEGVSLWVVPSSEIVASDQAQEAELFDPAADKAYRFATSYELPAEVDHM